MRLLAFALVALFLFSGCVEQKYAVSESGKLSLPQQEVKFLRAGNNISFQSFNANVYGVLRIPQGEVKGIAVFLPGAEVAKEGGSNGVGLALEKAGFLVLTIDARGTGESKEHALSIDDDFSLYKQEKVGYQHGMIADAIQAMRVLRAQPEAQGKKSIFVGESMGGRVAIIAASLDSDASGVLVISSSGYNYPAQSDATLTRFLQSFDPLTYVASLPPKKLVSMHSRLDKGVPFAYGVQLYQKAEYPKEFVEINCPEHGYCTDESALVGQKAFSLVQ